MPNEGSYEAAVRRSDEIQADLAEHAGKYNMLTGDPPYWKTSPWPLLWHYC